MYKYLTYIGTPPTARANSLIVGSLYDSSNRRLIFKDSSGNVIWG